MMNIYPAELQSWINAHGGLTPHMIFLKGSELSAMVSACSEADIEAAHATQVAHHRPNHPGRMVIARGHRFRPIYAVRPMVRMY